MTNKPDEDYKGITDVWRPLFSQLSEYEVELDQRLRRAFETAAAHGPEDTFYDSHVFHALLRLNSSAAWRTKIDRAISERAAHYRKWLWLSTDTFARDINSMSAHIRMRTLLRRALLIRRDSHTISTPDFLRAIALQSLDFGETSDLNFERPFTLELLAELFDGDRHLPLSASPNARKYIDELLHLPDGDEDFQFVLTTSDSGLVFRCVSVLRDFVQTTDAGLLVPKRAMLMHFQDSFGGFTAEEIQELEALLNSGKAREDDFQRFLVAHTHFFRKWDYREVHPHVYLSREELGPLVPDFILTDRELQKAAIVELKLPTRIIRRQRNRDRFGAALSEARAQLLRYRDWFDDKHNRSKLKGVVGMEIYRPRLSVIIGRSSDFRDEFDRQQLSGDNPDVELVTYDDLLAFAKRRRLLVEGAI